MAAVAGQRRRARPALCEAHDRDRRRPPAVHAARHRGGRSGIRDRARRTETAAKQGDAAIDGRGVVQSRLDLSRSQRAGGVPRVVALDIRIGRRRARRAGIGLPAAHPTRGAAAGRPSMNRRATAALAVPLLVCGARGASAQQVSIDQGVRAGGLWCFPVAASPKDFVYLPSSARLSKDAAGNPSFSFVRYVIPGSGGDARVGTTEAAGGGLLHFVVELETPADAVT